MTTTIAPPRSKQAMEYPTRDGRPMAETGKHREIAYDIIQALKTYFAPRPDVYVSGNNFVFWQEGNPKARISPDAYVVFGSTPDLRASFLSWKEDGRYVRLELSGGDRLHSTQLGPDLVQKGKELRLYDPARERFLPPMREMQPQAEQESSRAQQEARRAQTAEAEPVWLRAELEALKN